MRRTFVLVAGILAGALATELSIAARFTTHLDAIEGLLTTRAADPAVPTKVRKSFQSALKRLGKDTTNLSKEIATARKVIGTIEKKAPDDAELMGAASTAVGALGTAVANYIETVSAEADALPGKKPSPAVLAQRFLTKARDRYQLQFSATSLAARLRQISSFLKIEPICDILLDQQLISAAQKKQIITQESEQRARLMRVMAIKHHDALLR